MWRFAGAMLAQTLAILEGVLAMLRPVGVMREHHVRTSN